MKRPTLESILRIAGVISLLTVSLQLSRAADEVSGSNRVLKPFQAESAPAPSITKPKSPKFTGSASLAGPWIGTFTHDRNGAKTATTYAVNVGPKLATLSVVNVQSDVALQGLEAYLQPTTERGEAPAQWDGTTLSAQTQENLQNAGAWVEVKKHLTLSFGRDSKHALFTYDVDVKSVKGPAIKTFSLHGSGILTRPRPQKATAAGKK